MFDTSACHRPFSGVPLSAPAWLFWVLVPILGLLVVGLWFWLKGTKQQKFYKLAVLAAGLVLILGLAEPGLTAFLPKDPGTTVGAIVVLGRGSHMDGQRLELAAQLWRAKRAPLIFLSGVYDGPRMLKLLATGGVPRQGLDAENCSLTTPQNAQFTAAILKARGTDSVILITDAPHLQRAMWDFAAVGLQVIPKSVPVPSQITGSDRTFLIAREYFFLITTWLADRLNLRPPVDAELAKLLAAAREYGQPQIVR